MENIKKAFGEFAAKLPEDGYLVCDQNDENLKEIIGKTITAIIRIIGFLAENAKRGDVVITMGAGDVFKIGEDLLKK